MIETTEPNDIGEDFVVQVEQVGEANTEESCRAAR
jgi:hypothetical protein